MIFNKIQNKLLVNCPLLWNIKFIPMGITVVGFNILFFIIGFVSFSIDLQDNTNYYNKKNETILILISILTSLLIVIIWLPFYLKNNSFKSFYPKKESSLYWEWLLIFILLSGNCLYSFSYLKGVQAKEKSYASKNEVLEAQNLLSKIEILIPDSDSYYYIRKAAPKNVNSENMHQTQDSISISLLNYDKSGDIHKVQKWLIDEKKDSIRNLISQYLALQKKYNLTTNLTEESWMKLIYNPPTYTISNYISKYKPYENNGEYFVEYQKLTSYYREIYDAYDAYNSFQKFILVLLYIALHFSLLLLSFRTTSGKSWLTGIVISGLLMFIFGITIAFYTIISNRNNVLYIALIYWSSIFLFMCLYTGRKIYATHSKGKSAVMINLILWMLPYIPMLFYNELMIPRFNNYYDKDYKASDHIIFHYFDTHPTAFFWINLIFVSLILIFITKKIKKWYALPEE